MAVILRSSQRTGGHKPKRSSRRSFKVFAWKVTGRSCTSVNERRIESGPTLNQWGQKRAQVHFSDVGRALQGRWRDACEAASFCLDHLAKGIVAECSLLPKIRTDFRDFMLSRADADSA